MQAGDDPRIAELDNIRQGRRIFRQGMLGKIFGRSQVEVAVHMSPVLRDIQARAENLLPYLNEVLSSDNDDMETIIHANFNKTHIDVPFMSVSRQYHDRSRRTGSCGRPQHALHKFGMSQGFGELISIFNDLGKYYRPVTGDKSILFLIDKKGRVSENVDKHLDIHSETSEIDPRDYSITNIPLLRNTPATVVEMDGKWIRFEDGSAVTLKGTVYHATPEYHATRPIMGIQRG